MKQMKLPAIQHRKKKQMAREYVVIQDLICNNIINTSSGNMFNTIVEEICNKSDGNLLGTWDIEIKSYLITN